MFKVQKLEPIKWPVDVRIPRDGGNTTAATFYAQFNVINYDEFQGVYDQKGTDRDLLRIVCVGWDQSICDENGDPIAFSAEALNELTKKPYVCTAMVNAYLDCANGRIRKN